VKVLDHIELEPFYEMLDESIPDKLYMLCSLHPDDPGRKVWLITGQQYASARVPTREEWLAGLQRQIAQALRGSE
jgi:hypothetical protein